MGRINGLDDMERSISARGWRAVCLGVNEDGEVKGSDTTWTEWRLLVGIVMSDGATPDPRWMITQREAFLLLARSRIKEICQDLKIKKPRNKDLTIFQIEEIADRWLETIDHGQSWKGVLKFLASGNGMTGKELEVLIQGWLGKSPTGKPRSTRTIYRVCARSGVRFSRKRKYTPAQIQKVFHRTQKHR